MVTPVTQVIPSFTEAPSRTDPENFDDEADLFLDELEDLPAPLNTWSSQVNVLAGEVNTLAGAAATSAAASAASAATAAGHATAAAAGAGTSLWVSGTSYTAITDIVVSPIDKRSYRRTVTGAGTTDPSADTANWILISWGTFPMLHVREQYSSGTDGASLVSTDITQNRSLNTVVLNTISGASLASDQVTLPAGTYDVSIRANFWSSHDSKIFLYNTSDSSYTLIGSNCRAVVSQSSADSFVVGRFTITASKNFKVRYWVDSGGGGRGGQNVGSGQIEIYCDAIFTKVG